MKRIWIIAGLILAVGALAATVALADSTTPVPGSGYGRRIQGGSPPAQVPGPGAMIGRGPGAMIGRGPGAGRMGGRMGAAIGCSTAEAYDPAAMLTRHEALIAQQAAQVAALETQIEAATDQTVKARLTVMLERMRVSLGAAQAKLAVIQALPADYLEGMIALAKSDIAYFSSATSADGTVQAFIAQRLAAAEARLAYFEAQVKQ